MTTSPSDLDAVERPVWYRLVTPETAPRGFTIWLWWLQSSKAAEPRLKVRTDTRQVLLRDPDPYTVEPPWRFERSFDGQVWTTVASSDDTVLSTS